MMDLSLREVVSKGKQSVNSALKSKKGWIMQVGVMLKFYILMIIYLRYWCMCFPCDDFLTQMFCASKTYHCPILPPSLTSVYTATLSRTVIQKIEHTYFIW